ncbi:MAG: hypothetical protein WC667_09070 [Sulfurimonas sp.]|jgi:hypothetical protein
MEIRTQGISKHLIHVYVGDISKPDFHDLRVSIGKKVRTSQPLEMFGFLFAPKGIFHFQSAQDGSFELLDTANDGISYRFEWCVSIFEI